MNDPWYTFSHTHQEIIVQNFRAKEGTKMVNAPEPDLGELLWTIACARIMFGSGPVHLKFPPPLDEFLCKQCLLIPVLYIYGMWR